MIFSIKFHEIIVFCSQVQWNVQYIYMWTNVQLKIIKFRVWYIVHTVAIRIQHGTFWLQRKTNCSTTTGLPLSKLSQTAFHFYKLEIHVNVTALHKIIFLMCGWLPWTKISFSFLYRLIHSANNCSRSSRFYW